MAALTGFQPVTYALEGHCSCIELQSYTIYYLASGEGLEPSIVGVKVPCAYQFHTLIFLSGYRVRIYTNP